MSAEARKGWHLSISGEGNHPGTDRIDVIRYLPSKIRLEIDAPGIRSVGEDQSPLARQAIQAAVTALQEALDSPSALPGLR